MLDLKEFEKEYTKLAKKYSLPSFKALNEDFEIDKIERETFCILRLVRKVMMEKIVNSLNFLEMLINPINVPRIYMAYVRSMTPEDRRAIEKIYGTLGALSVASLELEVDYTEKREAEMIKQIYKSWNEFRPAFREVIKHMQKPNGDNGTGKKDSKSYFG